MTTVSGAEEGRQPVGLVVGEAGVRIWGMTSTERLHRIFRRVGVEPVAAVPADRERVVLLANAGWVFDEALLRALSGQPGVALVDETGAVTAVCVNAADAPAAASDPAALPLKRLTALELGSAYNSALRKREAPVLERLTPDRVRAVEKRLFQGSYKGVTDLVTKYVWPAPARIVTRWCALAGMTPNQVTMAGFILVLAAFGLFWTGHFALGLVCAWIMTFLDTVDGKLARVTLTSSKLGNVFDHGIDLVHPPFWWWAWLVGVQAGPHPLPWEGLFLAIVAGGYVAQRIEEGVFLARFKLEMHAWRPFDSFFRLITARRNPNLILLTLAVLVGRPDLGLVAVAIWTVVCFCVHAAQIVQAARAPKGSIKSWLAA